MNCLDVSFPGHSNKVVCSTPILVDVQTRLNHSFFVPGRDTEHARCHEAESGTLKVAPNVQSRGPDPGRFGKTAVGSGTWYRGERLSTFYPLSAQWNWKP